MVFSSFTFLCLFLPIVVIIYFACCSSRKLNFLKNLVLLTASLIFYAWGEPRYLLIMLFSTVFDYVGGLLLVRFDYSERKRKAILVMSIVVNIGLMSFFKYTDFILTTVGMQPLKLALPLGISFYTFQTLSYTIDVYRRLVPVQRSFLDFATYISMFPQLIAGPIVRYQDVYRDLHKRKVIHSEVADGCERFLYGLGKKILLANQLGVVWEEISSLGRWNVGLAWIAAIAYTLQIYFDFSGYSDMAIGLGQIFGFSFPENFAHPYESKSITEFWRRWHMTLSTWFREYVYYPLGGNRKGKARQILNLLIVWALTGIWHGAGWNFMLWGFYYFVILTLEKLFLLKVLKRLPKVLQHAYALVLIIIGWVIFANTDLTIAGELIRSMFMGGTSGFMVYGVYAWTGYGILIIVSILAATTLPDRMMKSVFHKEETQFRFRRVMSVVILILCFAFLVGDAYNPFLYFRF